MSRVDETCSFRFDEDVLAIILTAHDRHFFYMSLVVTHLFYRSKVTHWYAVWTANIKWVNDKNVQYKFHLVYSVRISAHNTNHSCTRRI